MKYAKITAEYEAKKAQEEEEMKKLDNAKNEFELDGVTYTQTKTGYCYKTTGKFDKKGQPMNMRIGKHIFEQAFEQYLQTGADNADSDEWDAEQEITNRKDLQEKKDRETEDNFNGKKQTKKAAKSRRSKDVAFEMNTLIGHVTLTAKQVQFLKLLPKTCFWEEGVESVLWCDCIADDIGWNPMSVGAMISTLREKKLVVVAQDTSRKGKPKSMTLTTVGQVIAEKLGLH